MILNIALGLGSTLLIYIAYQGIAAYVRCVRTEVGVRGYAKRGDRRDRREV